MHTILGSGGSIGKQLAKSLSEKTDGIRLVSRNPKQINPTDELISADLTSTVNMDKVIQGSEVVYVTVGLEYSTKVWQQQWVPLMKSVIESCRKHQSKLVFFDNVYSIGGDNVRHITEESPISPTSKKGEVRAEVCRLLLSEMNGGVPSIIARSADFYGPDIEKSMLMQMVWKNLRAGKKAQWMLNAKVTHSFTYTPDAGKAMAVLGTTDSAFNRVWNLPTDAVRLTGEEWIGEFAKQMNRSSAYTTIPSWMFKAMGIFVPFMGELVEMGYQFDRDYFFDSSAFTKAFGIQPTPYQQAIKETIQQLS
jgi:nucleoside-diphosphate-sugar epimerase